MERLSGIRWYICKIWTFDNKKRLSTIFLCIIFLGTLGTQALPHNSCIDLRTREIGIKTIADYEIHHYPKKVVMWVSNLQS